jgi:hypothetical protein
MLPEPWLILIAAAVSLIVAAAGSLAAGILLHRRFTRFERLVERSLRDVAREVREQIEQLDKSDATEPADKPKQGANSGGLPIGRGWARAGFRNRPIDPEFGKPGVATTEPGEPPLIAVPNLEVAPVSRDETASALKERFAAIWALADTGAAPEVIARATGQPVGQIELILGLRRQIDGNRTTISHAPHI